jgi:hypothetical protein
VTLKETLTNFQQFNCFNVYFTKLPFLFHNLALKSRRPVRDQYISIFGVSATKEVNSEKYSKHSFELIPKLRNESFIPKFQMTNRVFYSENGYVS